MHDNKVRLSQDVLEKAEQIAAEWGLKNARAAVEAVFRKYCDDYLYGRMATGKQSVTAIVHESPAPAYAQPKSPPAEAVKAADSSADLQCEALAALDQLLAL